MQRVLCLDLATVTGWAEWSPGDKFPRSGTVRLPSTGKEVGRFLVAYEKWLDGFLKVSRPDVVVFEAPVLGPKTHIDTARKLMCLAGNTEMIALKNGIDRHWEVKVQTVRKHFCGTGNGPSAKMKKLVQEACLARNWRFKDDNEADALAILDYAAHSMRLEVPWSCGPLFLEK